MGSTSLALWRSSSSQGSPVYFAVKGTTHPGPDHFRASFGFETEARLQPTSIHPLMCWLQRSKLSAPSQEWALQSLSRLLLGKGESMAGPQHMLLFFRAPHLLQSRISATAEWWLVPIWMSKAQCCAVVSLALLSTLYTLPQTS